MRSRCAAWIPSSLLLGGILMSVTTTSGCSLSTAASRDSRSPHTAVDFEIGVGFEQPPNALTDEEMIIGDHQPQTHGARIRP